MGPHKALAPYVKYDGRIGEYKNYRYIVHYPEDGKYTIKKLPMTKLGGRDPVTKFKVIQVSWIFFSESTLDNKFNKNDFRGSAVVPNVYFDGLIGEEFLLIGIQTDRIWLENEKFLDLVNLSIVNDFFKYLG